LAASVYLSGWPSKQLDTYIWGTGGQVDCIIGEWKEDIIMETGYDMSCETVGCKW